MKAKFFLIVIVSLLSLSAFSQFGGGGYYVMGYNYFFKRPVVNANINGLDNTLLQGFPVMGGGGHAVINGFVIGGSGFGSVFVPKINLSGVEAYYFLGQGEFDLGHVLFHTKSFVVFAYLGFGGFNYGIELVNETEQRVDLDVVEIGDGCVVSFKKGSFTVTGGLSVKMLKLTGIDLGLNINYLYPIDRQFSALMVGLTFGGFAISEPSVKREAQ